MTREVIPRRQTEEHTDGLCNCMFCLAFGIGTVFLVSVQTFKRPNRNFRCHVVLLSVERHLASDCYLEGGTPEFSCFSFGVLSVCAGAVVES